MSGPTPDHLVGRRSLRQANARLTPPDTLGPVEPEPPLDVLPQAQGSLVAMVKTAMSHLGMDGSSGRGGLEGIGVGQAPYVGTARIAQSADDAIETLEPGDVLVVTSDGGILSHAAVLARELGIPALIGVGDALNIVDGSIVEVDPIQGLVRVMSGP